MKTTLIAISLVCSAFVASSAASAQVVVQLGPVPTIAFVTRPTLVFISPGIQVVEAYDDEVFFVNSYYWVRRGPVWYRTASFAGGWVVAETRYVPVGLLRISPGHYRNYRGHGKRVVAPHSSAIQRPAAKAPKQEGRKGRGHKR